MTELYRPSPRAEIITRRTYNRPLADNPSKFETWEQTVDRVMHHQTWLWERQLTRKLNKTEKAEIEELRSLMLNRKASTSGRTLWLGGTNVAKTNEASQFNCSFTMIETVYDVVDALWLLLQGCGVGFTPVVGGLNGFGRVIPEIEVVRSVRTAKGGNENNVETYVDGVWTIKVGDSARAWAKSIGKLLANKNPASKLVLDFSEIRPAGERLTGYGWISSGDEAISEAYASIAAIMNRKAGQMLSRIDILDLMNHLGTILSSRRSAQIALFHVENPEWQEFAVAKKDWWLHNPQRRQSNNSLGFASKPSRETMVGIFDLMADSGGSEPGFINTATAKARAPWFAGPNPCCEILLANRGFCNLMEVDLAKFMGDMAGLLRTLYIAARANYRQTCVNLRDGILQEAWHLNNEFLRLCGVGLTGIAQRDDLSEYDLSQMERMTNYGAYSMANELGTQLPKNVTTVKPSGTLSKIMDTTEGIHKPLGKYIINNVNFGKHDPMLPRLRAAGYRVFQNPSEPEGVLVAFPVKWENVDFSKFNKVVDGKTIELEVNLETAIEQLDRYKKYQTHWTQQNTSVTISYSPDEVPAIIDWLLTNWDSYMGVSFLYRADPTLSAKDLGYEYLPQEVITKDAYEAYVATIAAVDLNDTDSYEELVQDDCASGACPIK